MPTPDYKKLPQSLKASKPQSLKASKPQSLKASKASKPQSLKASKALKSSKEIKPQKYQNVKNIASVLHDMLRTCGISFCFKYSSLCWKQSI